MLSMCFSYAHVVRESLWHIAICIMHAHFHVLMMALTVVLKMCLDVIVCEDVRMLCV